MGEKGVDRGESRDKREEYTSALLSSTSMFLKC